MYQENVTAVVIKSSDYKDNDRLLKLFSLENGVITAVIKGVKKANAKLKFAAQVFAFCNFSLTKNPKTGYLTVTGAVSIEDMFGITSDIDKFLPACVCLEAVNYAVLDEANTEVFVLFLKTLKTMLYSQNVSPMAAASFFLLKVLKLGGFTNLNKRWAKEIDGKIIQTNDPEGIAVLNTEAEKSFKDIAREFERCYSIKLITLKSI